MAARFTIVRHDSSTHIKKVLEDKEFGFELDTRLHHRNDSIICAMVRKFVIRMLLFVAGTHAFMSTVKYYDMNSAHIEQECFMDSLQCCVPLDIFVTPSVNERFTADVATIRRGIHMHWFPRDEYRVYKHPQESCQGQSVEHFDQDGPPMMVRTQNYEGIGISGVLLGQPRFPFKVVYPREIRYHGQVYRYGHEGRSGLAYFRDSGGAGPEWIYGRPYGDSAGRRPTIFLAEHAHDCEAPRASA